MPATTNHAVNLPTVGADADVWGTENNDAHQAWDTLTAGAQNTVLGRVAASSGPYTQLSATQLTTIPNAVVGDSGAGGTKGLVPAPASGDAAARKFLMASGAWVADERKGWAVITGSSGAVVAGRNIACTRIGLGEYDITFSVPLASANYAIQLSAQTGLLMVLWVENLTKTASGFTVFANTVEGVSADPTQIFVEVLAA